MGTWRRFFLLSKLFWKLINYNSQIGFKINNLPLFIELQKPNVNTYMKQHTPCLFFFYLPTPPPPKIYEAIHYNSSVVYAVKKMRIVNLDHQSSDNSYTVSYLSVRWPSRISHFLQPCISTHAEEDHSNAMKCLFSSKDLSGRRTINTNSFCWGNERVKAIRPPIIQTHRNYFHII